MQSSSRDAAAAEMKRIVGYSGRRGLGRGGKVETFFFAYIFFSVVFVFSNETRERERGGSRRGETNFFSLSEFFFISFASFPRAEAATLPPPPRRSPCMEKEPAWGGPLRRASVSLSEFSIGVPHFSPKDPPPKKLSSLSSLSPTFHHASASGNRASVAPASARSLATFLRR